LVSELAVQRPRLDHRVRRERPVDVGEDLVADPLVADLGVQPLGRDRQQHQVLARAPVEAVEDRLDLVAAAGVDEALLGQGPPEGRGRVATRVEGGAPVGLGGDVEDALGLAHAGEGIGWRPSRSAYAGEVTKKRLRKAA
jgi:hypothetical protein